MLENIAVSFSMINVHIIMENSPKEVNIIIRKRHHNHLKFSVPKYIVVTVTSAILYGFGEFLLLNLFSFIITFQ